MCGCEYYLKFVHYLTTAYSSYLLAHHEQIAHALNMLSMDGRKELHVTCMHVCGARDDEPQSC